MPAMLREMMEGRAASEKGARNAAHDQLSDVR